MRILIEEYEYDVRDLESSIPNYDKCPLLANEQGKCRMEEVGYYYSQEIGDCIFILPKVVIQGAEESEQVATGCNLQNLVFGKYRPEDIINLDKPKNNVEVEFNHLQFIRNFSVWIYRAINVYRQKDENLKSVKYKTLAKVGYSDCHLQGTILDSVIALLDFYKLNKNFVLFAIQNNHRGYNHINWHKTVSRQIPLKQSNGSMVYLQPVNKKQQVFDDDELFIIYFSILHYLKVRLGFELKIDARLNLLNVELVENLRKGLGKVRLKQIKYRYFSDKTLRLWNLCYSFFDLSCEISSVSQGEEYLVAKKFEHVFEDIIDNLLQRGPIPSYLKKHKDGKQIDHIFEYESLINDNIYYIGDSKYYKIGHEVKGTMSEYKQYTYAKNVIQYNLDLFLQGQRCLQYRDELTEGYNITPNFFISGQIKPQMMDYDQDGLAPHYFQYNGVRTNATYQCQFPNRLFDRDTLWLSHYDINFLYVLSLYVRANNYANKRFRNRIQGMFREKIIEAIGAFYDFYILKPKRDADYIEDLVHKTFWKLNGKLYRPFKDKEWLLLALYKNDAENNEVLNIVKVNFAKIDNYKLGLDIETFIQNHSNEFR